MLEQLSLTIAHVLSSFHIGGAEQVALNIAARQVLQGHRVHAIALTGGLTATHAEHFRSAGVQVHAVDKREGKFDPLLTARLARRFGELAVDVVHTHNPLPLIYGAPGGRLASAAVVHTKHGFNHGAVRQTWLRRIAGRCAHYVVGVSQQTARDALAQRECAPRQLRVILNGIDLARYRRSASARAELRREFSIPHHAWVFGSVGRLSPIKNQALLVRAAAPLLGPETHLVLVGEGEARSTVEAAIQASGRAAFIHLAGRRLDVPRLLAAFDLFVLSSDSEGLPMVLPEAMAAGLPVVSTRVGGIGEVVQDGRTGALVAPGDELGLREAMRRFRAEPALAARCGNEGREIAIHRYSAEHMVDCYMDLYSKALAGRRLAEAPVPQVTQAPRH